MKTIIKTFFLFSLIPNILFSQVNDEEIKMATQFPNLNEINIVEIRIEASQPAFNNTETLSLIFQEDESKAVYSGLSVQGQRQSYELYPADEQILTQQDLQDIIDELDAAEWKIKTSYPLPYYPTYTFHLVWKDKNGTINQYSLTAGIISKQKNIFKILAAKKTELKLFIQFINETSIKFCGHSFESTVACRYD